MLLFLQNLNMNFNRLSTVNRQNTKVEQKHLKQLSKISGGEKLQVNKRINNVFL